MAGTIRVHDPLTGLYRGELWDENVQLARHYASGNFADHRPATYFARKGGDEFGALYVSSGAVVEMQGDFTNLSGLNPGLSTEEEIAAEQQELNARLSGGDRRQTLDMVADRRTPTPDGGPAHSLQGYRRADEYLKAMVSSFVGTVTDFQGPVTPEAVESGILTPFHEQQRDFNTTTELDRLDRLKKDNGEGPVMLGTGLAVAATVMSAENDWQSPDPHTWEQRIAEAKQRYCQTASDRLPPGQEPLQRLPDVRHFEISLAEFQQAHPAAERVLPEEQPSHRISLMQIGPQSESDDITTGETRAAAPWYMYQSYGIMAEVLVANASELTDEAAGRTSPPLAEEPLAQYRAIVNDVMNTALNGSGRVLHLVSDVRLAANTPDSHLALFEITKFSGLNAMYAHTGCDAVRAELLEHARTSLMEDILEIRKRNPQAAFEEYSKTGRRNTEDAAKTGFILHGVTQEEAQSIVEKARGRMAVCLSASGLDYLPSPKAGHAGVQVVAVVEKIPQREMNYDDASTFIAGSHIALELVRSDMCPETRLSLEQQQQDFEPFRERAGQAVAEAVRKHAEAPPAPAIDYFRDYQQEPPRAFASPLPAVSAPSAGHEGPPDLIAVEYIIESTHLAGR